MLIHLQMKELNGPAYSMILVVFVVMASSPKHKPCCFCSATASPLLSFAKVISYYDNVEM